MSVTVITKVLIEAASYDLVELAVARDELKIDPGDTSNNDWLTRAITQISILIQSYLKRPVAVETIQDTIYFRRHLFRSSWRRSPNCIEPLQLSRWPLTFVGSVHQATPSDPAQALTADQDYAVDTKAGQLTRLDPTTGAARNWERLDVVVDYEAGYEEIPPDIVYAALRLVVNRWHARGRDPLLLERVTPMVGTERWWVGGPKGGSIGGLPAEVQGMLDLYRVPGTG